MWIIEKLRRDKTTAASISSQKSPPDSEVRLEETKAKLEKKKVKTEAKKVKKTEKR
jgi:hypothetical protein